MVAAVCIVMAGCSTSGNGSETVTPSNDTDASLAGESQPTTTTADPVAPISDSSTTSSPTIESEEPVKVTVERLQYRDSKYVGTDGQGSVVDVHVPGGADDLATIVLLHGFGRNSGSADFPLRRFAPEIARLGAVVFEFHWQSSGITADSQADLSCIGPFTKAHAAKYGGDPDNVIIVGHSWGAETGSTLALSSFGLVPAGDCAERGPSPRPVAFLGIGGSYGVIARPLAEDRATFHVQLSPLLPPIQVAATEEVAPGLTALDAYELDGYSALPSPNPLSVVLLVGDLGHNSPIGGPISSKAFRDALEEQGTKVDLVIVPGSGHLDVVTAGSTSSEATLAEIRNLIANS
jgi:acetyl esterase/lipase